MDDSQKIYCLSLLFFESEIYNKNFPDAREITIRILENFGIIFEQKYYFSNGYIILKIRNPIEEVDYPAIHPTLNERWGYWFYRWNNYNEKIFYQNILNNLVEIKESIPNLERYRTYIDLVYLDLVLLTINLKKLIDSPDLMKEDKKEELKTAIKCLNKVKNDIQGKKIILKRLINYLEDFFKKEFPLERLVDLLFKELEKKANSSLKQLDFLSDLIYVKITSSNMDIPFSLFDLISSQGDDLKNLDDIKKYLKEKLIEISDPKLNGYTIFYPINNIKIVSKIPPFQELHFFNRKIDESYSEKLGTEFPSFNHWIRVIVNANGIDHALFLSEIVFNKYCNFGLIKDLHFKLIRKNHLIFKNNKRIKTSHSIEDKRLYRIKPLDDTKSKELRDFLNILEKTLEKIEFQRINTITELLRKVENTFDITDQLTFLWIIIETLKEGESYRRDFAKILTIIDEVEVIQEFYMAFFSIVQNNWDFFEEKCLSQTILDNFPKKFSPKDFIDSLDILSDALNNNYMKQKIKEFSGRTPLSHYQRIKLKNKLNYKLLLNIYKYRNQYFHSGFYDLLELRKIIPILHRKLIVLVESYISYLIANKNKNFKDFKKKWINSYELFLEQLFKNKRYSECFSDLLGLIESFT